MNISVINPSLFSMFRVKVIWLRKNWENSKSILVTAPNNLTYNKAIDRDQLVPGVPSLPIKAVENISGLYEKIIYLYFYDYRAYVVI